MKKKKIIFQSNYPLLRTGLGKNTKYVLDYLYRTGKYDITLYAMGLPYDHEDFARFPYKVHGCLPTNPMEIQRINSSDEGYKRFVSYGGLYIDKIIQEVKPDIWVGSDDWWSFGKHYVEKPWFSKINSILHITLDSLPILPEAIECAPKVKNYFVWSQFAQKEMHRLGHKHIKTIHGTVSEKDFFRLPKEKRLELRHRFNLPPNAFIVGTDSRNQLRKEFPALLEGFSIFLKQNPKVENAFIFLITTHNEGWNLSRYVDEFKIPREKFLALYVCKNCQEIYVQPFNGQDLDCNLCNAKKSQQTIRIDAGCTESQLNDAYNLFDCVCHVFNAAGLELVHIQTLYAELPLASVNYAAGEDFCEQPFVTTIENHWTRQIGTEFKRSCPYPSSIAKYIKKIYETPEEKRLAIGKQGRRWAIDKFSPNVIGKQWEELFDSLPNINYDFNLQYKIKNDHYSFQSDKFTNDVDFIIDLYQNILFLENENRADAPGVKNWVRVLANGGTRKQVYDYFINEARKDNANNIPIDFWKLFDKSRPNKRGLMVCKESMGDIYIATALFKSFKEINPDYDLYFACDPKYFEILQANEFIFKILPYHPAMDNELMMIGAGQEVGFVHKYMLLTIATQHKLNYLSNNRLALEVNY